VALTMSDINYQLEALREIKGWSTWIVGLGSASLGALIAFKKSVSPPNDRDTKAALVLSAIAFATAVTLIATVPFIIDALPTPPVWPHHLLGMSFSGIYSYLVLGFIPLWVLQALVHTAVLAAALFGFSMLWRELFGASFLDRRARLSLAIKVSDPAQSSLKEKKRVRIKLLGGEAWIRFDAVVGRLSEVTSINAQLGILRKVEPSSLAGALVAELETWSSEITIGGRSGEVTETALTPLLSAALHMKP
jgi:hypothetical protein